MISIVFIVLLLSTSYGFLLEKNNTGGTAITDQHYIHLLSLLTQEKENAQQMAQLILRLNNEVKSLQQVTGLNHGNGSSKEMTDLKNGYSALQKELIQVKQEINIMKNDNYALAKKNQRLQSEITTLETQTKQSLWSYQNSTNQKINDAFQRITAINQTVVMTSCADGGTVSPGSVVKFSYTKTIYGVSDVSAFKSSGKFTCEVGGVYLFSAFIMPHSNPSVYSMYKNNDRITYVNIIHGRNNDNSYHTGTGIVAVSLNVGNTLYIKADFDMYVNSYQSCMTVIKIR